MAKRADPGDMRTKVRIMAPPDPNDDASYDADGYLSGEYTNILPNDGALHCKWVNSHGTEIFTARQLGLIESATLTMRYHPSIMPTCLLYRAGDDRPFEIISLDNVENLGVWPEAKVARKVASK